MFEFCFSSPSLSYPCCYYALQLLLRKSLSPLQQPISLLLASNGHLPYSLFLYHTTAAPFEKYFFVPKHNRAGLGVSKLHLPRTRLYVVSFKHL
jgi:hypothetical protein